MHWAILSSQGVTRLRQKAGKPHLLWYRRYRPVVSACVRSAAAASSAMTGSVVYQTLATGAPCCGGCPTALANPLRICPKFDSICQAGFLGPHPDHQKLRVAALQFGSFRMSVPPPFEQMSAELLSEREGKSSDVHSRLFYPWEHVEDDNPREEIVQMMSKLKKK